MISILCLGDSLTDCGRLYTSSGLGDGYVKLLTDRQKEKNLHWNLKNRGNDGFTILRLLGYLPQIERDFPADLVTILIGINDVAMLMEQKNRSLSPFFKNYRALLDTITPKTKKILLMEPFLFPEPAEFKTWFPLLEEMNAGIRDLAEEYNCRFVPLQSFFLTSARQYGISALTIDGVHLTDRGQMLLTNVLFSVLQDLLKDCEP